MGSLGSSSTPKLVRELKALWLLPFVELRPLFLHFLHLANVELKSDVLVFAGQPPPPLVGELGLEKTPPDVDPVCPDIDVPSDGNGDENSAQLVGGGGYESIFFREWRTAVDFDRARPVEAVLLDFPLDVLPEGEREDMPTEKLRLRSRETRLPGIKPLPWPQSLWASWTWRACTNVFSSEIRKSDCSKEALAGSEVAGVDTEGESSDECVECEWSLCGAWWSAGARDRIGRDLDSVFFGILSRMAEA